VEEIVHQLIGGLSLGLSHNCYDWASSILLVQQKGIVGFFVEPEIFPGYAVLGA
jgi:hypothetical protein